MHHLCFQPELGGRSVPLNVFKWVGTRVHLLQTYRGLTVSGKLGLFFMAPSDWTNHKVFKWLGNFSQWNRPLSNSKSCPKIECKPGINQVEATWWLSGEHLQLHCPMWELRFKFELTQIPKSSSSVALATFHWLSSHIWSHMPYLTAQRTVPSS